MRGVNCPFEHSEDVIIPNSNMMFPQFPFVPPQPLSSRGGRGGKGKGRGQMHNGDGSGNVPHHPINPSPNFSNGFPQGFPMGMPFPPFPLPTTFNNGTGMGFMGTNKPPVDRSSTTLVVTDIPPPSFSITAIREQFIRFGEVTNIALEGKTGRALVSFGTNAEAYRAWKSDEPVFDSRHVKVLWHRPRPGQGGAGQKALEASAGLMANMSAMDNGIAPQGDVKANLKGPETRLATTLAELEAKERRTKKETLIAEQKVLLKKAKEGTKEGKLVILKRLKELNKEMESLDKPQDDATGVLSDKEKLDRELEKHGMETGEQDELMRLSAHLSALRDKVNFPMTFVFSFD